MIEDRDEEETFTIDIVMMNGDEVSRNDVYTYDLSGTSLTIESPDGITVFPSQHIMLFHMVDNSVRDLDEEIDDYLEAERKRWED